MMQSHRLYAAMGALGLALAATSIASSLSAQKCQKCSYEKDEESPGYVCEKVDMGYAECEVHSPKQCSYSTAPDGGYDCGLVVFGFDGFARYDGPPAPNVVTDAPDSDANRGRGETTVIALKVKSHVPCIGAVGVRVFDPADISAARSRFERIVI